MGGGGTRGGGAEVGEGEGGGGAGGPTPRFGGFLWMEKGYTMPSGIGGLGNGSRGVRPPGHVSLRDRVRMQAKPKWHVARLVVRCRVGEDDRGPWTIDEQVHV